MPVQPRAVSSILAESSSSTSVPSHTTVVSPVLSQVRGVQSSARKREVAIPVAGQRQGIVSLMYMYLMTFYKILILMGIIG